MTIELEIIDRVFRSIEEYCIANGIEINDYMSSAIMDRFYLDKYGDLNEKLVKKNTVEPDKSETSKKRTTTRKTKEKKNDEQDIISPVIEDKQVEVSEEEKKGEELSLDEPMVQGDSKPNRVKRTLKTK